jgi:hypothetical protein
VRGVEATVLLVAFVGAGIGAALGVLVSRVLASRRETVEARLDGIEHMLTAPDQAWYWTPEWQAGETAADADLAAARSTKHGSAEEFLAALDGIRAADEPSRSGR